MFFLLQYKYMWQPNLRGGGGGGAGASSQAKDLSIAKLPAIGVCTPLSGD